MVKSGNICCAVEGMRVLWRVDDIELVATTVLYMREFDGSMEEMPVDKYTAPWGFACLINVGYRQKNILRTLIRLKC